MYKNRSFFKYLKWIYIWSPIFIGIIIITGILISYNLSLKSLYKEWRQTIISQYKFIIKRQVNSVTDMMEYERRGTYKRLNNILKQRSNEIYFLINDLYEVNKSRMSKDEILKVAIDTLITEARDRGYGNICLTKINEKSVICNTSSNEMIGNLPYLMKFIKTKGEGIFKSNVKDNKVTYVKLFKPLDVVIVVSYDLRELEGQLKKEILDRVSYVKFGKDGYIFILDSKGIVLAHRNKKFIGKNLSNLNKVNGPEILEKFLRLVKDNGGGYTRYVWEKPSSGQPSEKISYVIEYKPWKWIIGTGVYLDDMAGMFDLFKSRLNGFTKNNLILSLMLLILILSIFWFIFRSLMLSSIKDIEKLTSFFKKSETEDVLVDIDRLNFSEFKSLAVHVNRMLAKKIEVQDRLIKEKEQLDISEQRYKTLIYDVMDSSNVGLLILDKNFKIVWVNKALEKIFSIKREDVIGKDKVQLIEEKIAIFFEDPDEFKNRVISCYKNNTYIENFVCHMLPAEGRYERWLEHWSCPIKSGLYKGGRVEHYTDITDKVKAFSALEESENKLRSLFNAMTDMILEIDKNGRYIYVIVPEKENPIGRCKDELLGKTIFDVLPRNIAHRRMELILWSLEKNRVATHEYSLKIDGKEKFFEARISPKTNNSVLVVSRDITEKKKMELDLLDREENLRITLNSIAEGVIVTNTEGNIIRVNPSCERFLNLKKEDLVGKNIKEIISLRGYYSKEPLVDPVSMAFKENREVSYEETVVMETKHKINIPVDITASPIRDASSPEIIRGVVIVFNDITDKIKREIDRLNVEKMRSISVLAGGIAHDFNNMLTGIFGNIELAKLRLPKDSPANERLKTSMAMLEKARGLTSQLLTFAKGGDPVLEPMDVKATIKEAVKFHLTGSNVKPVFDIDSDLWVLRGDKSQIVQAISNIVINAKEAMPNGGNLYVEVKNVTDKFHTYYSHIKIAIRDEGIGIPKKYLNRIFDPYFTTKQMGSGLGLSIVFSIVKRHKGHIEVQSTPGEGSTFIIYLPALKKAKVLKKDQYVESKGIEKITGRVLIMDDEETIADLCKVALEDMGLSVDVCGCGEDAVSLYEEALKKGEKFDLVIMDLTIPGGMGGKDAIKRLLEMDPNVRAIVSSGYSNDPVMNSFSKHGFMGRLVKPFKIDDLKKEVVRILT